MQLNVTDTGIYYIHDYIPVRYFEKYPQEKVDLSKRIWDYKKNDEDAIKEFTPDLLKAIVDISDRISKKNIGLVAVPPSKVDKNSPIRTSIGKIHDMYQQGGTKLLYGCDKVIYDYSKLLQRREDVATSHEGKRASYEDHKRTISCIRDDIAKYNTAFILLDDIATLETSMKACTDILLEHGAKDEDIYRLVIARTVNG